MATHGDDVKAIDYTSEVDEDKSIKDLYDEHPMISRLLVQSVVVKNNLINDIPKGQEKPLSIIVSEVLALACNLGLTIQDADKIRIKNSDDVEATYCYDVQSKKGKGLYVIFNLDVFKTIGAKIFKNSQIEYNNNNELVNLFNKHVEGHFTMSNVNDYSCVIHTLYP
ncbi:MAG: hypothetical protein ACRDD8_14855 [Bacteroidales bacterium]